MYVLRVIYTGGHIWDRARNHAEGAAALVTHLLVPIRGTYSSIDRVEIYQPDGSLVIARRKKQR
jgi:hypothetical protein